MKVNYTAIFFVFVVVGLCLICTILPMLARRKFYQKLNNASELERRELEPNPESIALLDGPLRFIEISFSNEAHHFHLNNEGMKDLLSFLESGPSKQAMNLKVSEFSPEQYKMAVRIGMIKPLKDVSNGANQGA